MNEALREVPKNRDKSNKNKEGSDENRKKPVHRTFALVLLMVVFVGSITIVSQLVVGYIMLWIIGTDNFTKPIPMALYSAFSYILIITLILYLSKKLKAHSTTRRGSIKKTKSVLREELGLLGLPTWTDIGLAPIGFLASLLLAAGLVGLFSLFSWFNPAEAQSVGFNAYVSGFDRIIAFLVLVVIAPFFEEIIFRGWLYGKIRERFSGEISNILGIVLANFLVSLTFGIIHLQWNVGVNVFALSVVLCILREITGTIYAGILVHILKNGVAFYLLYVLGM